MSDLAISLISVTRAIDSATAAHKWSSELDLRGGSPPDHFRAVLEALNLLPVGHPQFLRSNACPTELLGKFAAQDVSTATEALPDGSWRSVLCRSDSPRGA